MKAQTAGDSRYSSVLKPMLRLLRGVHRHILAIWMPFCAQVKPLRRSSEVKSMHPVPRCARLSFTTKKGGLGPFRRRSRPRKIAGVIKPLISEAVE